MKNPKIYTNLIIGDWYNCKVIDKEHELYGKTLNLKCKMVGFVDGNGQEWHLLTVDPIYNTTKNHDVKFYTEIEHEPFI